MSSSVGAQDVNLEKMRSDARRGKWSEVFETCKQNRALYTAKITGTGDTVLHMAVSNGKEKLVANMLDFLVREENNLTQNDVVISVDGDEVESCSGDEFESCSGDEVESWSVNVVLGVENDRHNTPLHLAAVEGNVEMCKKIGERDPSLIARRNIAGETPLFLAALYGRKEAFLWLHYLYMEDPGVSSTDLAHCIRDDNDTILHCAIAEGHFDVAIEIVHLYKDHLKEMMRRNKEGLSSLHLLAAKPSAFKTSAWSLKVEKKNQATTLEELRKKNQENSLVKHMKFIQYGLPFFLLFLLLVFHVPGFFFLLTSTMSILSPVVLPALRIWLHEMPKKKEKHTYTWSLQIMNRLLYHCSDEDVSQIISRTSSEQLSVSLQREEFNESESMAMPLSGGITIDTPLMIAVKNGVVEMVERILDIFPSRIKDVNAEGKNIVLLAVEYRQTEVFRFLCKQKWLCQSLFGQVDKEGNNALHLAASVGVDIDWLNPREINWFEYVKNSIPRGLLGRYNRKMKTPEDIFTESLKELVRSEGEWVAKASQACSVVSTLVLSVAFATCTSVPGSHDAKGGYVSRRNNTALAVFVGSSILAVFFSFISTIIFLSIVVSRSQPVSSWIYVPLKLYTGMIYMFYSILFLWISFCAANSSTYGFGKHGFQPSIFFSFFIFLFVVVQCPTFFGPIMPSFFRTPARRHNATRPIEYRKTKNNQDSTDLNH